MLRRADRKHLLALCEPATLVLAEVLAEVLCEPGEPLRQVCFPIDGTVALVTRLDITTAAASLQRQGLVQYHRGQWRVLDRAGLEAVACSCDAADRLACVERP